MVFSEVGNGFSRKTFLITPPEVHGSGFHKLSEPVTCAVLTIRKQPAVTQVFLFLLFPSLFIGIVVCTTNKLYCLS